MRFQSNGLAKFSEILAKSRSNIVELCEAFISELISYVEAEVGAIFTVKNVDEEAYLNLTAFINYDVEDESHKSFAAGEGYVGTCYEEKKTLYFDNLPESYVPLSSGLGEIHLKYLIFVPIIQDTQVLGVMEIASIEKLPNYCVEFIEKLAVNLASVIAIREAGEKMNELLELSNQQTEEMRSQEEEMHQNLEEMLATQEEMQRQLEEHEQLQEELKTQQELVAKLEEELTEKNQD